MVKTINLEHCFDSEGCSIKDGVQNGRQLGSYISYLTNILAKKTF